LRTAEKVREKVKADVLPTQLLVLVLYAPWMAFDDFQEWLELRHVEQKTTGDDNRR
jgi:hypothetical protein